MLSDASDDPEIQIRRVTRNRTEEAEVFQVSLLTSMVSIFHIVFEASKWCNFLEPMYHHYCAEKFASNMHRSIGVMFAVDVYFSNIFFIEIRFLFLLNIFIYLLTDLHDFHNVGAS